MKLLVGAWTFSDSLSMSLTYHLIKFIAFYSHLNRHSFCQKKRIKLSHRTEIEKKRKRALRMCNWIMKHNRLLSVVKWRLRMRFINNEQVKDACYCVFYHVCINCQFSSYACMYKTKWNRKKNVCDFLSAFLNLKLTDILNSNFFVYIFSKNFKLIKTRVF